jgi:hypothetical protein
VKGNFGSFERVTSLYLLKFIFYLFERKKLINIGNFCIKQLIEKGGTSYFNITGTTSRL